MSLSIVVFKFFLLFYIIFLRSFFIYDLNYSFCLVGITTRFFMSEDNTEVSQQEPIDLEV